MRWGAVVNSRKHSSGEQASYPFRLFVSGLIVRSHLAPVLRMWIAASPRSRARVRVVGLVRLLE
jgi:hypothetical protein